MKRYLVLLVFLLASCASSAFAQATYTLTTTPTFVINDGRSETLGNVRLTATNAGPTISSTINILFTTAAGVGVGCDNDNTTGVALNVSAPFVVGTNVTGLTVTNTGAGCTASFTIAGGVAPTAGTSFVELRGVRGRVDMSPLSGTSGQNINGSVNATPSNSSVFTIPNVGVVGTTAPGLVITLTPGSVLQCIMTGTNPTIQVKEGFNGAFVQHVITAAAGSAPPVNPRPLAGATNNTQIQIIIAGLPTGVTLTWPAVVVDAVGPAYAPATIGKGAELQRITAATAATQIYEFATGDQGVADIQLDTFNITPVLTSTATAAFGTATAQAQLWPGLQTPDATVLTSVPNITTVIPRFNDPLQPAPAGAFATNAPCRTNLLFPWVVFLPSAGFDTGLAIANTSTDPFGTFGALAQGGTCTLNGFPTNSSNLATPVAQTPIAFTTANIPTGASWASAISTISPFNATTFTGYVIAVCNFQYGHGFAFISDNLGTSNGVVEGYLALLIPDPNVVPLGRQSRGPGSVGTITVPAVVGGVAAGGGGTVQPIPQAGEGLVY